MKVLFVHQNFPGQYLHLARHLGATPGNQVVFITQRTDATLPGVKNIVYKPQRSVTKGLHHYLRETEAGVLNAQNVARVALDLKQTGFVPDVMLGHNGWGELWYLKDVFPDTPLIGYFEFFYRLHGADVGFEPGPPLIFDTGPRLRTKNLGNLVALDAVDLGQCPTQWQKSLYPQVYQPKLQVTHEGIDTALVAPDAGARFQLPKGGAALTREDEVLTYVARNLEPYRGFPSLMRSLPQILQQRPKAQVLIVGGDETSYGPASSNGQTFKAQLLQELGTAIDLQRVHFLGKLPYSAYLQVLQVSSVHVYLTYPFVLSWSMLEAMAAGCLVVSSRTAPVEEVIRDGENGLLVDIFSPQEIAQRVIEALQKPKAFDAIRKKARQTIVDNYDLKTICLPAQLQMLSMALQAKP
jgi:glycosyltransferase involved in cell wall biosynthesis